MMWRNDMMPCKESGGVHCKVQTDAALWKKKKEKEKSQRPTEVIICTKLFLFFLFVIDEFNHILKINPYTMMYDIQYCFLGEKLYTGNIIICI